MIVREIHGARTCDGSVRRKPWSQVFLGNVERTKATRIGKRLYSGYFASGNGIDMSHIIAGLFVKLSRLEGLPSATDKPKNLGEVKRLNKETFERLYDPALPTLAMAFNHGFDGAALLACSAQRLKEEGEKSINTVLLVPSSAIGAEFRLINNKWFLTASRGILVDGDGIIYHGSFPEPIVVDMVDHSGFNYAFLEKCERLKVPLLNSLEVNRQCRNKSISKIGLQACGFKTPKGVSFAKEDLKYPKLIERIIREFLQTLKRSDVVIKPAEESSGIGVIILEDTNIDQILSEVIARIKKYDFVMLEERIRSYPFFDEEGRRLDWNGRLLITPNGVIDIEARVNYWGTRPINKATGARIQEIDLVFNSLGENRKGISLEMRDKWKRDIASTTRIAEAFGGGFLGLDPIFDEQGDMYIIETNSGSIGGFGSLSEIRERFLEKLKAPTRFASLLAGTIQKCEPVNTDSHTETSLLEDDIKIFSDFHPAQLLLMAAMDTRDTDDLPAIERYQLLEDFMDACGNNYSLINKISILLVISKSFQRKGLQEESLRVINKILGLLPEEVQQVIKEGGDFQSLNLDNKSLKQYLPDIIEFIREGLRQTSA